MTERGFAKELQDILLKFRDYQSQSEILQAQIKAEFAALDAAVLTDDKEKVEEIRTRLHNLVDSTIDLQWTAGKFSQKISALGKKFMP